MSNQIEKQIEKQTKKTKTSGRGGARPGSGRPKGSTNKVSTSEIVSDFQRLTGKNFAKYGHEWMHELRQQGQNEQALKIYSILHKYHIDDSPQRVDVTSNGETMTGIIVNINAKETGQYE